MLEALLGRVARVRRDPQRIVDYLRIPRPLVRGTPLSNRLGLQAARAVKEQVVWQLRRSDAPAHLRPELEALEEDGFVVIENFLPDAEWASLDEEVRAMEALPEERLKKIVFGPNYESRLFFASKYPDEFPAFARSLRDNSHVYELARTVARRQPSYRPHVLVQWVYKPEPEKPCTDFEYNSYLHVDRHYPFLKAFYYLRDVPPGCAPYTFVRGSHKFNWERLRFEYLLGVRQSAVRWTNAPVNPEQKARDRVMEELARDLRDRLRLEEVPIVAKRNTLIISNNQGLHRRGEMSGGGTRVTANLDFKFFESPAQALYPILRRFEPVNGVRQGVSPW